MDARHVLITGGANGLGLGCALRFARAGAAITIADRDEAAAASAVPAIRAAGARDVQFEPLDLADATATADAAARLLRRGRPIDVLVNNAGIYPPSQRTLAADGQELTFAIAHLGHFRLTHALWPLLQAAGTARVVSVSSLVQRRARLALDDLTLSRGYQPILAYQQAKLACLLFALELQRRLDAAGSPIRSYAAHPGVCRTQLGRNRRTAASDRWWQRLATAALRHGLGRVGQSPENGAAAIVEAATSPTLPGGTFVGPTGLLEATGAPGPVRPGPAASDPRLAEGLWARSEALTGLRWTRFQ